VEERLKKIMSRVFGVPVESINNDSSLDTIDDWDSITHMNLALAIEQAFDITLEPDEIIELISFELILAILKDKGIC
jgi:acyl carrier protein|tara:strand:- start:481 stop:711 length:231 start_codon:yes stop_codon:yes gene_type:complete